MSNPTELPDLEVCPFCGNEAEMVDNGTGSWRVACLQSKGGCGATGRMTFDGGVTAAREWNRRAQPEGEAPQAEPIGQVVMYPNYSTVIQWREGVTPPAGTLLYDRPPAAQQAAAPAGDTNG